MIRTIFKSQVPAQPRTAGSIGRSTLSQGLIAAWDIAANGLVDVVNGEVLTPATAPGYGTRSGMLGSQVNLAFSNNSSRFQLPRPFSIAWRGNASTATATDGIVFGKAASAGTNANPCYSIQTISAFRNFWISWKSGAGDGDLGLEGVAGLDVVPTTIVSRFTTFDQTAFVNGRGYQVTGSYSDPTYGTGELWLDLTGGCVTEYALIWNRPLSVTEMQQLTTVDPWGWKRANSLLGYSYPFTGGATSTAFSPFTVGFNA
jgi:hypothetical protein